MTYVITQSCCNDAACVDVCPVDCIHPRPDEQGFDDAEMLHIDPRACVDCGACVDVCPAGAIVADHEMTARDEVFLDIARDHFAGIAAAPRGRPFLAPAASVASQETLRVAIVGTGPSACYAALELLRTDGLNVRISMFDRLPVFGGLLRHGVAPDHPDTKSVAEAFERDLLPESVELFLNVEIGRHLSHEDLLRAHHAVIYAAGAAHGRSLGIPGDTLPGSCTAADFVGWYNGHPDYAHRAFDLSTHRAVIIGNGNVALDVARILAMPPERLAASDIAEHARLALMTSRIQEIIIAGRRGPAQMAGTTPELLGLASLPGIDVLVDANREHIQPTSRKSALLAELAERRPRPGNRRIVFRYARSPVSIEGTTRVEGIRFQHYEDVEQLDCGLVIASVGYRGMPIANMPFDEKIGAIANIEGRVIGADRAYAAGWMKRGPSGLIGTNKRCSAETIAHLLADFEAGRLDAPSEDATAFRRRVTRRQPNWLGREGWQAIDSFERAAAKGSARIRLKLVDRDDMVSIANSRSAS